LPEAVKIYVRWVDAMNRAIGRFAMYLIFVMMGILLYSSITKTFFIPPLWTLEMAQFVMVAYYLLGGAYSMQLEGHVRMDLIYGSCSTRRKAWIDSFTVVFRSSISASCCMAGFRAHNTRCNTVSAVIHHGGLTWHRSK
jgi:TRAP-type mannitol/chloroaromatic compound transport system permease small subunit